MTEKDLQKTVEDYLTTYGIPWLHCTTFIRKKVYIKCGCGKAITKWVNMPIPGMKGWPDLLIFFKCGFLALELKQGGNTLTPEQRDIKANLEQQGYRYEVAYTWEKAKEHIDFRLHAEGKL